MNIRFSVAVQMGGLKVYKTLNCFRGGGKKVFCAGYTSVEKNIKNKCNLHKKSKVFYTMISKNISKLHLPRAQKYKVNIKNKS